MSYQRQLGQVDYGQMAEQAEDLFGRAKPALRAGLQVLKDPAFPEVTELVLELREVTKEEAPPGARPEPGVGLRYAVPPLKAFVYYRKHPAVIWAGAAAALGVIFAAGYAAGKKRKRGSR